MSKNFDFLCRKIKITHYEMDDVKGFDNAEKPCFVCFSDLHLCRFGKEQELLLARIDECSPDAVFIAGDLVNSNEPGRLSEGLELLKKLSEKYKVFYAPGNHEEKLKLLEEYAVFVEEVIKTGIVFLDNTSVEYLVKGHKYKIYGLALEKDYFYRGRNSKLLEEDAIESFLGESSTERYNILLAHTPEYFSEYAKWKPDLILSGHYHGGLCRLPFLGGVLSPKFKLFPKFSYGKFSSGMTNMLVSSGLGYHTLPLRIFNPAEILYITFK